MAIQYYSPPKNLLPDCMIWMKSSSISSWGTLTPEDARASWSRKIEAVTSKTEKKKREDAFEAFEKALASCETDDLGDLPRKAFSIGSLLKEEFRVLRGGGEDVNGRVFTGEIRPPPAESRAAGDKRADKDALSRGVKAQLEEDEGDRLAVSGNRKVPPPILPAVLELKESGFNYGVERFESAGKWVSVIEMSGNRIILGTFDSKVEAALCHDNAARRISNAASSPAFVREDINFVLPPGDSSSSAPTDVDVGALTRLGLHIDPQSTRSIANAPASDVDLESTSFQSLICEVDDNLPPNHSFSMHDWVLQMCRSRSFHECAKFVASSKKEKKAALSSDSEPALTRNSVPARLHKRKRDVPTRKSVQSTSQSH